MSKLTCREIIEFLDDYIEQQQDPALRASFEKHMDQCPCCKNYLETYKHTIHLSRKACCQDADSTPPQIPEALIKAILAAREENQG